MRAPAGTSEPWAQPIRASIAAEEPWARYQRRPSSPGSVGGTKTTRGSITAAVGSSLSLQGRQGMDAQSWVGEHLSTAWVAPF